MAGGGQKLPLGESGRNGEKMLSGVMAQGGRHPIQPHFKASR